jgi:hypothetical protein
MTNWKGCGWKRSWFSLKQWTERNRMVMIKVMEKLTEKHSSSLTIVITTVVWLPQQANCHQALITGNTRLLTSVVGPHCMIVPKHIT